MKKIMFSAAALFLICLFPIQGAAESNSYQNNGIVEFDGGYAQEVYDPENPGKVVDPGESPSTNGLLRIDFVPTLSFGRNQIGKGDQVFSANAQLFHDDTNARGNFVQVSDYRATKAGWTLQLRQETQFKNDQTLNHELKGAVLSFDKSWVNSIRETATGPSVKKEVIRLENIGDTYTLAQAEPGKGEGSWAITYGASEENTDGQDNTLTPSLDASGNPVIDPTFNKPVSKNSAVTLTLPEGISIDPVPYTTVLTWILSELP